MKRLLAAVSGISIVAALLTSAGPAHAADSTVTGTVTNGTTSVSNGMVYYYANCDDYLTYGDADRSGISAGAYSVTVPDGTYRVRIQPDAGQNAVESWHNGKATCEQADVVTVSGAGTQNLVARFGYNVSGTISSTNGQVLGGDVAFYASCRAYRNNSAAGSVSFAGGNYSITVPAGIYYALITPGNGTGAVKSWHDAQALCSSATPITINSNTIGKTLHPRPGTNLSGTIGSSRGPINSALIQFFETCQDFEENNQTASAYPSNGTYAITLPAGTYRVRITLFGSSDGALNSWHNAAANCASATTITVAGPTDTESLLARSAAVVTGSVTRAGGALLKGGSVAFYENCQAYLWGQSAGYGYIDENGQYRAAVAPGKTYIVRISPEGGDAALASWHNGVMACDQATSIAVPGDGSHNLVAAPGFVITGTVTSSSGTVEDGYVSFYTDCDEKMIGGSATIVSGKYTLSLPAGTYRVQIQPGTNDPAVLSWHNAKAGCEIADLVTVAGSGPIDLVASGAARVTGHVSSANGPVASGTVGFYPTCEDYTAAEPTAETYFSNGAYGLTIPNGTYRVLVAPSLTSNAVKSWHNAAPSCEQAAVVTVNGNAIIDPVAATGTHVTGSVTSSSGSVSSGNVYFYESCLGYQNWDANGLSRIREGQYSVWLPPGTYRAQIQPSTDTAARSWHSAKSSCDNAEVITVAGTSMSQGIFASAGVDVTGLVTKGGKPVAYGYLDFYATCQDFLAGQPSGSASIEKGLYTLTLAPGPYRALITVSSQTGEKYSWHSATGTCGTATEVSVSGPTIANLQARETSTISGSVSGPTGLLGWGSLAFYATCQDYLGRNPTAFAQYEAGAYSIGVPVGSYLVRVFPYSDAAISWHNAATGCGSATAITVTGAGTHNVVAARGAVVTGSVSSSAGPVKSAHVAFYPDCQAYYRDEEDARGGTTKGVYSVNIVPGTYRVLVMPDKGTGARKSWHAAKATCETAELVTIAGDATVNLVALPKYAPVIPPPPVNPDPPATRLAQTVKKPPKSLKEGKKVRLAKKTRQGTKVTWKSKTKKVCVVKKSVLKARKKGKCKISASAPGTPDLKAFSKRYTIRVR